MSNMKKVTTAISAAVLMACSETSIPENNFDKGAMDSLLSTAVESKDVIGVSALVFNKGQTVYKGAFGQRDRERDKPVELDTVWRIYSMTKPITSVIIMDLQEEGKLSLQEPVSKYIHEYVHKFKKINSHT